MLKMCDRENVSSPPTTIQRRKRGRRGETWRNYVRELFEGRNLEKLHLTFKKKHTFACPAYIYI